jgi:putative flavoprotein involved in K+ transport
MGDSADFASVFNAVFELRKESNMPRKTTRYDVVVIGGGQAGLSVGYHLKRQGVRFLILDASARIGDVWRSRWDSLRLFTCARFSSLDGWAFPAHPDRFPTKDEMADYLEAYAAHFELPVLNGIRVTRLAKSGDGYVIEAGRRVFEAAQVVVAMAHHQQPRVPAFASQLDPEIVQLHSKDYRNVDQLRPGPVLLVGAGNSGSELALELSKAHPVVMSGRDVGHMPFRIDRFWGRVLLVRLVLRVLFHRILTISTPIGRRARAKLLGRGVPWIRVKPRDLDAAGVERTGRTEGVEDGQPVLADGRRLEVANVIWCTGFHSAFSWIDLDVFTEQGWPRHVAGAVPDAPGLYFVGLPFVYSVSSEMIHGVGRDAERIARLLAKRSAGHHTAATPRPRSLTAPAG